MGARWKHRKLLWITRAAYKLLKRLPKNSLPVVLFLLMVTSTLLMMRQDCDGFACYAHDVTLIQFRSNFSSKNYMKNTEHVLLSLFPPFTYPVRNIKAASLSRLQGKDSASDVFSSLSKVLKLENNNSKRGHRRVERNLKSAHTRGSSEQSSLSSKGGVQNAANNDTTVLNIAGGDRTGLNSANSDITQLKTANGARIVDSEVGRTAGDRPQSDALTGQPFKAKHKDNVTRMSSYPMFAAGAKTQLGGVALSATRESKARTVRQLAPLERPDAQSSHASSKQRVAKGEITRQSDAETRQSGDKIRESGEGMRQSGDRRRQNGPRLREGVRYSDNSTETVPNKPQPSTERNVSNSSQPSEKEEIKVRYMFSDNEWTNRAIAFQRVDEKEDGSDPLKWVNSQPLSGTPEHPMTQPEVNDLVQEHPALQDFRMRAQRLSKLCPAIVARQSTSYEAPTFTKAWEDFEIAVSQAEHVKGVFWHEDSRTAYCFVPKAGCTFWIRVFAFLQNSTGIPASSPWDLPRLAVHTKSQNPHAQGAPLWFYQESVMGQDVLRFLVTRDPFSRLWSAYVDKFLLPDFWRLIGTQIVSRYRRQPTEKAKKCGHDVTFSEFVQFALVVDNSHWEPIHRRCDPCRFQPQVIADIDTFSRDSEIVLRRMGIEPVLHELSRTQQRELELKTLIDYNFDVMHLANRYTECINKSGVSRLLWKAFQMNGYLPVETLYYPAREEEFSMQAFKDHVVSVFRKSAHLHDKLKIQKNSFMHEAYRSLSPELIEKLKTTYSLDFELFGYDYSPFT